MKTELENLKAAEKQLEQAREDVNKAKRDLALKCPVQPGDTTEVTECSYRGKKMLVDGVAVKRRFSSKPQYKWVLIGYVLKKDGEPGKNQGEAIIEITEAE